MAKYFRNLVGQKFSKLTPIRIIGKSKSGNFVWECQCDCGNIRTAVSNELTKGYARSCGCAGIEGKRGGGTILPAGEAGFNRLCYDYKIHAKRKNLEFNLSKEQIKNLTSKDCYYCGAGPVPRVLTPTQNGRYVGNGIDRVDSNKGYTIDNCVPCCTRCNRAKLRMSKIIKVYLHSCTDFT